MAIHVVLYDSFMGFVTKYYRKGIVKDGAGESVIGASVLQRVQPMVQLQTLKEVLL